MTRKTLPTESPECCSISAAAWEPYHRMWNDMKVACVLLRECGCKMVAEANLRQLVCDDISCMNLAAQMRLYKWMWLCECGSMRGPGGGMHTYWGHEHILHDQRSSWRCPWRRSCSRTCQFRCLLWCFLRKKTTCRISQNSLQSGIASYINTETLLPLINFKSSEVSLSGVTAKSVPVYQQQDGSISKKRWISAKLFTWPSS